MDETIYEAMGGTEAVLALAEAWHERCLAELERHRRLVSQPT